SWSQAGVTRTSVAMCRIVSMPIPSDAMGIADRYWEAITRAEARVVLGPETELVTRHRRWLFAVARCRTPAGDVYLKRQPPMGRTRRQIEWQHPLPHTPAATGGRAGPEGRPRTPQRAC